MYHFATFKCLLGLVILFSAVLLLCSAVDFCSRSTHYYMDTIIMIIRCLHFTNKQPALCVFIIAAELGVPYIKQILFFLFSMIIYLIYSFLYFVLFIRHFYIQKSSFFYTLFYALLYCYSQGWDPVRSLWFFGTGC